MKKITLILIGLAMSLLLVQCSSLPSLSSLPFLTDPAVKKCNKKCEATNERCLRKAGKSARKKHYCKNALKRCSNNCKKKAKGYKKPKRRERYHKRDPNEP